jgi:hypothetical protein
MGGALSPLKFRLKYINKPPHEARLLALDSRVVVLQDDENQLKKKAWRFKVAAGLLALSVLLVLFGSIVSAATDSGNGGKDSQNVNIGGERGGTAPTP